MSHFYCYSECSNAECRYAECRGAVSLMARKAQNENLKNPIEIEKKGSKPQILLAALAARRHLGLTPHPCPPRSTGPRRHSFQTRRSSRKDRQETEGRHSNPFKKNVFDLLQFRQRATNDF